MVETANFKRNSVKDNWGDFDKISPVIIQAAQALRSRIGFPIYVTSGFRESSESQHGKGLALDIISPDFVKAHSLFDMFLEAEKISEITGLGLYPYWKYENQLRGGLHIDCREGLPYGARWMGVPANFHDPLNKHQAYLPLNLENLKKHKVLI